MAKPRGMSGAPPARMIPGPVPPLEKQDMLERNTSMSNRANVPFELPVASFMRAKFNVMQRHDEARKEQQLAGGKISKHQIMENQSRWEQECRDHEAMRHYTHHFIEKRGAQTVKRSNIVIKKD